MGFTKTICSARSPAPRFKKFCHCRQEVTGECFCRAESCKHPLLWNCNDRADLQLMHCIAPYTR